MRKKPQVLARFSRGVCISFLIREGKKKKKKRLIYTGNQSLRWLMLADKLQLSHLYRKIQGIFHAKVYIVAQQNRSNQNKVIS